MIDYLRMKPEPKRPVEMRQQQDEEAIIRPVPEAEDQENPPNFHLLVLNLVMFMCALSLIVYGVIHLDDCPAEKMIAVSYIVLGGLIFLSLALNIRHDLREVLGGSGIGEKPKLLIGASWMLQLFMIAWFVASCKFIYHIQPYIDKKDPKSPNYCSEDYFKSVFWVSATALAVMGLFILIAICGCCYFIDKYSKG